MKNTIDQQRQAVSAARAIITGGKAPRKNEAAHLVPILLEAEATLALLASERDIKS